MFGCSPLSCGHCYPSARAIWWQRVASAPDTPGRYCSPPPHTAPSPKCSYWLQGTERDFHGNQNTHYHELSKNQNLSFGKSKHPVFALTLTAARKAVLKNSKNELRCQPSKFITKTNRNLIGWGTHVLPLELKPLHWRMGFPYLTSCLRLRLNGSDQYWQIRREKSIKQLQAIQSHSTIQKKI